MRKSGITILCMTLVLSGFLLLTPGCGSTREEETTTIVEATKDRVETEKEAEATPTTESLKPTGLSIEEQVLVDTAGVKITATGIEDDATLGKGVKLLIENNSDINVIVECDGVIVNNYMVSSFFDAYVDAGKKANTVMYLESGELEAVGINHIGQIEVYFHGYESEFREGIFLAKCATIQTSEFSDMENKVLFDGKELVNRDGVRIVGKFVDEDNYWGSEILFYVENTSGKTLSITCPNIPVNGVDTTSGFSTAVFDGKTSIAGMRLASDLDEKNIVSIDEVTLTFYVDEINFHSIARFPVFETEPIVFSAK